MNQELLFLIDSIKSKLFSNGIHLKTMLSERIIPLAEYNGVMPFLSPEDFNNCKYSELLLTYNRTNAISNLISIHEFIRVTKLLNENKIQFLPYKGHLYLEILYKGAQLREIGDLDFLIHYLDAEKAMKILVDDGYELPTSLNNHNYKTILTIKHVYEISLTKKHNNHNSNIDFHWGLIYSFLPYKIDLLTLFKNKTVIKIKGIDCVSPSDEVMFVMLILHHGGRDVWMKLKLVTDLIAFMEVKINNIDWAKMLNTLTEMKLKRPMLVGFFLLNEYFAYELPVEITAQFEKERISKKLAAPIIDYWENCYDILSLKGRLKYERILWSIQDDGFSLSNYFKEMFKMYATPNPLEPKIFPANFYVLNVISKVVNYLWKRGIGKVVR